MPTIEGAYAKHKNLKLAANELGIPWQTLYVQLKAAGVPVVGDKLRYGSDRDKLAAKAESQFRELVPTAVYMNEKTWQSKWDFEVGSLKIDVKASMPRQLNKKYPAKSWSFSFKKQRLLCDFIICFCYGEEKETPIVLAVPAEFFQGLQTISVSCAGYSKWLDYAIDASELNAFLLSANDAMGADHVRQQPQ